MFPDRSVEIMIHKENAYRFLKEKNYSMARSSFLKWVESVRQQNINTGCKLEKELEIARKEYCEFAKKDPLYINVCGTILPKVKEQPGILQTDLYKLFPQFDKSAMSYTLYFAEEHGKLKRTKKGRTYALMMLYTSETDDLKN